MRRTIAGKIERTASQACLQTKEFFRGPLENGLHRRAFQTESTNSSAFTVRYPMLLGAGCQLEVVHLTPLSVATFGFCHI